MPLGDNNATLVFYLKTNTGSDFAMKCFWHWVDIVEAYGAPFYVLCDNAALVKKLENAFAERANLKATPIAIIGSVRNDPTLQLLPELIMNKRWLRVGYALLTPYVHGRENGHSKVWNIDADDSYLFASPSDCARMLKAMADGVEQNGELIGSVDFHYSLHYWGRIHWSFGVCYSPNYINVEGIIDQAIPRLQSWTETDHWFVRNIDEAFSNLAEEGHLKLGTYGFKDVVLRHAQQTAVTWTDNDLIVLQCAPHRVTPYKLDASQIKTGKIQLSPDVHVIHPARLKYSSRDWAQSTGGDKFAFGGWKLQKTLRMIPFRPLNEKIIHELPTILKQEKRVQNTKDEYRKSFRMLKAWRKKPTAYGYREIIRRHPIILKLLMPAIWVGAKTPNSILAKFLGDKFKYRPYYMKQRRLPIFEQTILYESFFGRRISDSPLAIFRHIVSDPRFAGYKHIWVCDDLDPNDTPAAELMRLANVEYISKNSKKYHHYLARAKYLVNDTHFPDFFSKREGQVYINTWHGTTLKHLGKDIVPIISGHLTEIQRNFIQADYLIEPNRLTSNVIKHAFYLDGIAPGKMLLTGYPRIDTIYSTDRTAIRKRLGVEGNTTLVSYLPTYRATNMKRDKKIEEERFLHRVAILSENLPPNSKLIIRSHHMLHALSPEVREIDAPLDIDTNELLAATDVLVTDYSSVFFDYLNTRRPIIFYCDDLEEYLEKWGVYLPMENLPGPVCTTDDEVAAALDDLPNFNINFGDAYRQFIKEFCAFDDGRASEKAAQALLGLPVPSTVKLNNGRPNLLVHGTKLTESDLNTRADRTPSNSDYFHYNVIYLLHSNPTNRMLLSQLDPRAHVFLYNRQSPFVNGTSKQRADYAQFLSAPASGNLSEPLKDWFKEEVQRIFGGITFEKTLNYTKNDPYSNALITAIDENFID